MMKGEEMSDKTKQAATLAAVLMAEAADIRSRYSAKAWDIRVAAGETPSFRPETVAADALALIKIGAGVARWAVKACNGEGTWKPYASGGGGGWHWGEEHDTAKDKADARALAKLQAIADRYGAKVKLGGDPRGYVVKLILASGRHNTWGGAPDGWGVA